MKTLTLAAVAVVALLGFLSGCDESQTMMEQVTREVTPAPEETVPVEEAQPTPEEEVAVEETPPAPEEETIAETFPARRGEVTLAETACDTDFCFVGISYTNDAKTDGSGQLTIYFDIPEALGAGPHRVVVIYPAGEVGDPLQTDIPLENKQSVSRIETTGNVHVPYKQVDYTEATLFLDAEDKVVFKYRFLPGSDSVRLVIGDAISGYAPGAVPVGNPPLDPDWDEEGQYYERSFELHSAAPVEVAPRVLRGEELVRATVCKEGACFVGISYTNEWNPDNTGRLTIYFDIPEALGPGPHRVLVRHNSAYIETDIPLENKQFFEGKAAAEIGNSYHRGMGDPYTEAILFLDSDDKIVFKYQIPVAREGVWLLIGDAISDYAPGAVPVGDPNQDIHGFSVGGDGIFRFHGDIYPYWEGDEELYHEVSFYLYGGIRLDVQGP